ncbi:MAG: hypothetical protein ACHQ50_10135 [Fimbriimonadales bacterium]
MPPSSSSRLERTLSPAISIRVRAVNSERSTRRLRSLHDPRLNPSLNGSPSLNGRRQNLLVRNLSRNRSLQNSSLSHSRSPSDLSPSRRNSNPSHSPRGWSQAGRARSRTNPRLSLSRRSGDLSRSPRGRSQAGRTCNRTNPSRRSRDLRRLNSSSLFKA